jgi:hypothetical protein
MAFVRAWAEVAVRRPWRPITLAWFRLALRRAALVPLELLLEVIAFATGKRLCYQSEFFDLWHKSLIPAKYET